MSSDFLSKEEQLNIEYDTARILKLTGNKPVNKKNAQLIYKRLLKEGISFRSYIGSNFLTQLVNNMPADEGGNLKNASEISENASEISESASRFIKNQEESGSYWSKSTTFAGNLANHISNLNRVITIFICSIVLILSLSYLGYHIYQDYRTNSRADDLWAMIEKNDEDEIDSGEKKKDSNLENIDDVSKPDAKAKDIVSDTITVQGKFETLFQMNPDFAGWLTIDGTKINYPVMRRTDDNEYYLTHDFDKKEDKNGALILDYRCNLLGQNNNLLIYGHNMKSGVMFGGLEAYKDEDFGKEHSVIKFNSLAEDHEYELAAVFLSQIGYEDENIFKYYNEISMDTEEEFQIFFKNIQKNSLYDTGTEAEFGDTFLMLSTCDYSKDDGRLVVVAKRVD